MACPDAIISGCDFIQALVDQLPKFDELIVRDITPTDGWLLNVSTGTTEMGTPVEITQDRFCGVWPNTTKVWNRVVANYPGGSCQGNPCDPSANQLGWGAKRRTYYAEEQTWESPLLCYNQEMHITHAEQHLAQIVNDVFRPATSAISSMFLRKRHLQWADTKWQANAAMDAFTYTWTLAGAGLDEEAYFDCSVAPDNVFLLVPQMLQNRWAPLMRQGYDGKNPFKDTTGMIELVTSADTCWSLDKLGGSTGVGGTPSVNGNWRFTEWGAANKYWRYGFSGQIGNYLVRVDEMGLRFNFVVDLGAGAAPNRYRYQIVLPYYNTITSGAGGAPGIQRVPNRSFDKAHFQISHIHHKMGMELLVPDSRPLNPDMPFSHISFGGQWKWLNHDLGPDTNGRPITNKWENKGQFGAWFKYYIRPLHTEFMEAIFHKREQFCVPEINTCSDDPGYPAQDYSSTLPDCE